VTLRVAVVDDQELIRDGFTLIVEGQPDLEVVLQAADGQELVDAVRSGVRVDVALVDIRMPGMDGLAATRALAGVAGAPAVVIVTTFGEEEYVLEALASGASGFLLKRCSGAELVAAIRSVAAGDAILSPEVTRTVIERMRARRTDVAPRLESLRLSAREVSVLGLVGQGATNKEIAGTLFLSESTIKTHIGNILAKTGSRDRVQLALLANRLGLDPT
jgi:DNA-binding NarL/FixJ family response regulator